MSSPSDEPNGTKDAPQGGGFHFNGPVTANNQAFIEGDNAEVTYNTGLSAENLQKLAPLFQPLKEQVQVAPADIRPEAEKKVEELHTELAKGTNASADRLEKIADGLLNLVPKAVGALTAMFASPILRGLVGPVSQTVLTFLLAK